jgi:RNA polymerase sigma-70 factor (ECF subfamily)
MSYGEQIALRGHADIESVASAAEFEVRAPSADQFLEKLRRGDALAYERLVAENSGDVYALLFRLTSDAEEARDLTQETFLRAFQSTDDQREQPRAATLPCENSPSPEQQTLAREREAQLREALCGLRRSYREAVILRDVEGFSYEEIAQTLQISIGTVKSRISRGRLELRRQLEGFL